MQFLIRIHSLLFMTSKATFLILFDLHRKLYLCLVHLLLSYKFFLFFQNLVSLEFCRDSGLRALMWYGLHNSRSLRRNRRVQGLFRLKNIISCQISFQELMRCKLTAQLNVCFRLNLLDRVLRWRRPGKERSLGATHLVWVVSVLA